MHIILGGTGQVGSVLANNLLEQGEAVTIVSHDPNKAQDWKTKGAKFAQVDIHNSDALQEVFRQGECAFLLNPPADPTANTDAEEQITIQAILKALQDSGLKKIVAHSTYGAQPGERIGDLGTLYALEQGLGVQNIPYAIQRAAYYMSNWAMSLETAQEQGFITSFFPEDYKIPMVAPQDLGIFAAKLMTETINQNGLYHVEGPEVYSALDVAKAFEVALQKPISVTVIEPDDWIKTYKQIGFSDSSARSYAGMTRLTLEHQNLFPDPDARGTTSLQAYIQQLVNQA